MGRNIKHRPQHKGFRQGNAPYMKTEIKDIVKIKVDNEWVHFHVKRWGANGQPAELYKITFFRIVIMGAKAIGHGIKKKFKEAWNKICS